jgi:hypothetical protein
VSKKVYLTALFLMRRMRQALAVAAAIAVVGVVVMIGAVYPLGVSPNDGNGSEQGATGPGVTSDSGGVEPSASVETLWRSDLISFGYEEPAYLVIQSEKEWMALWQRVSVEGIEPPKVDFETRTVLVAFYGTAPTTGYTVEIVDVVSGPGGTSVVRVEIGYPGRGCVTAPAITHPVHMVSISKSDGPFGFEVHAASQPCG